MLAITCFAPPVLFFFENTVFGFAAVELRFFFFLVWLVPPGCFITSYLCRRQGASSADAVVVVPAHNYRRAGWRSSPVLQSPSLSVQSRLYPC